MGGHKKMIHRMHRHLTQDQRKRWIALLLECADEQGVPDDPEFRSGADLSDEQPMPKWGWRSERPYQAPK